MTVADTTHSRPSNFSHLAIGVAEFVLACESQADPVVLGLVEFAGAGLQDQRIADLLARSKCAREIVAAKLSGRGQAVGGQ